MYGFYSPNIINGNTTIPDKKLRDLKQGDIVTLIVDCNEWKLSFFLKDQSETINIEPNNTYYFCMSIQLSWNKQNV